MDNAFMVDAPAMSTGLWPTAPKKEKTSSSAEAATAFQAHLAEAESGRPIAAAPQAAPTVATDSENRIEPEQGPRSLPLASTKALPSNSPLIAATNSATPTLPLSPAPLPTPEIATPTFMVSTPPFSAVPETVHQPIAAASIAAPTTEDDTFDVMDSSGDIDAPKADSEDVSTPFSENPIPTGAAPTTAPDAKAPSVPAPSPRNRGSDDALPSLSAPARPDNSAATLVAEASPTPTTPPPTTTEFASTAAATMRPVAKADRGVDSKSTADAQPSETAAGVEGIDPAAAPAPEASGGNADHFEKDRAFTSRTSIPSVAKPAVPEAGTYPSSETARFADHLSAAPGTDSSAGAFGAQASTTALPPDIEALMRRAEYEIRPGLSRFSLEVDPPEYGKLDIKLVLRRGRLFGEITAEDANVAKLVERDLGRLRDIFAGQGIGVEELSIRTKLQDGSDSARKDDHSHRGAASVAPASVEETAISHRSPGARESARSAAERGRLDRLV